MICVEGLAPWPHTPCPPQPLGVTAALNFVRWTMKIERFVDHHEAREAFLLSIAGVTAIILIESLLLLILY
jgi:hypothetical protein